MPSMPPVFDPEEQDVFLTKKEKEVLNTLSQTDISLVKKLKSENLNARKKEIIGVRSEDIIFLLDCIHKGKIPCEKFEIMAKISDKEQPSFYMTPNPESEYLSKNNPAALEDCKEKTFLKMSSGNIGMYSEIAIKQVISREIMPMLKYREGLGDELQGQFRGDCESVNIEKFLSGLAQEILLGKVTEEIFKMPRRLPAFYILGKCLKENNVDPLSLLPLLRPLSKRGGVLIAFDSDYFKDYDDESRMFGIGNELVFKIPSRQIEIGSIIGFEPLGEFEDKVLERIGAD